ncbi:hypothetical protein B0H16DRAFT_30148 [Mycena metata]|uniref:Cytochrome P450 n=1 Tax=Mycena metata TaxID=1033252 RepID=A0AAD7P396_9AGAR|nr:hypothetical protein B0H16DRAFT_30148 [Mycena metata]
MREISPLECFTLFSLLCCAAAVSWSQLPFKGPNLPPGPRTNWLGFSVVDLPKIRPWLTYAQWKNVYGDLIYIRVLGNPILVINSASVASDLLEKRGAKYSSRPVRTMIVDLIGWDWLVSGSTSRLIFGHVTDKSTSFALWKLVAIASHYVSPSFTRK